VILVTFVLTCVLPGDAATYFAGPTATAQSVAQIKAMLGLDLPLPEQFWSYLRALVHGDLGMSLTAGQPVLSDIASRLPAKAELTLCGRLIAIGIAIPLGIAAAVKQGSAIDHACWLVVTAGVSLPVFFTGLLLVYVFYFRLNWLPAPLGRLDAFASPPPTVTDFFLIDSILAGQWETLRGAALQLVLPSVTLGLFALAPIARITRAAMLPVLWAEFIRTARASGLSGWTIILTYGLRKALLPLITTLGMVFSFLLGANVLVEKVFAWPGIGSYAVEALTASDGAPVQRFVLTMAILYVALNLAIDLVNRAMDPRAARA
jgi:ABC-type dipeptide/oligopeptide/nickel transport system permease component